MWLRYVMKCFLKLEQRGVSHCFGIVKKNQESLGINELIMPRRRKIPARFESRAAEPHFPVDVQELYSTKQLTQ